MQPRFKVSDVVFLNEDHKEELRKKYKIIEIYSLDLTPSTRRKMIQPVINPVINRRSGIVEYKPTADYEYLIEPLTDGAGRRVKENDIEGEAE
jgi:hypothetical protein